MNPIVQKELEVFRNLLLRTAVIALGSFAVKRSKFRTWWDVPSLVAVSLVASLLFTAVLDIDAVPLVEQIIFFATKYAALMLSRWCLKRNSVIRASLCFMYEAFASYYLHARYNTNEYYAAAEYACKACSVTVLLVQAFVQTTRRDDSASHPYYRYLQTKSCIETANAVVYTVYVLSVPLWLDSKNRPVLLLLTFLCLATYIHLAEIQYRIAQTKLSNAIDTTKMRRPKDWTDGVAFDQTSCGICLDEDAASRGGLLELPCTHTFHDECVSVWFQKHGTCPACQKSVSTPPPPSPNKPEEIAAR